MVRMREPGLLSLAALLCLMLAGIHRLDAQQQEDSADLVFLIDGSNNVGRTGFNFIRDFLANYVERRLEVGRNRMQIAVVQYSDDVKIEFTLDEHANKQDLINALKGLRFAGGEEANLGAAVEYVVEQLFTSAAGSRRDEGVPQSLMIITGGPSSDELNEAANALRLNSIITFGIGVARADLRELQQIATDESFTFSVAQYQIMGQLENQIYPYIAGVAQRTIVLQPPTVITEVTEVNKRDIVFLIDGSSDMGAPSFAAIRDLVVKIINRLEIGLDLIRVGLAQYARDAKPEFYLNTFGAKKDVLAHLKKIRLLNSSPINTGAALAFAQRNFFTASAGSRVDEGIPQLLVLITSGQSRDDFVQPSLALKRAGILTFAIGSKNADLAELQEIAFDSSLAFQPAEFKATTLQALLPQVLTPLKTLTGVVVEGPTEVLNQRDIVFLLDGSVNVGSANFPLVRDFLINIINNLGISSEGTRIGLAQFSDTPRTEFYLNTMTSKSELVDRLGQLRIKGGNQLNIGSALQFVIRNHFTSSSGSRVDEKIPQLLVVLVAGKSTDNIQAAANDLLRSGVLTFCIGVRNADKQELETIAFNPSLVYELDDFRALSGLPQQILTPLVTYVRGEVTEVTVTEVSEDLQKDIVFLVDGSDDARSGFPSIRNFIQRVVEFFDVGQDKVRIAIVQYSDSSRPEFLLNTYSDPRDVIKSIQAMSPIGGATVNTGAALEYVQRDVFTESAGSRAATGVPQFLILLTAGKSRDDVRRPATSLKASGVLPYAFGTGRADRTELQTISFSPDFVQYVPDVNQMENAFQSFSQRIGSLTTTEIRTLIQSGPFENKRDILFLIDGSSNIAGKFPAVREFVANIIDGLDVSSDGTRVSLGLVGENVKVEFKFDSFATKSDAVNAVKRLRFRPSKEFKIGAALDYARENLFTPEAGSRMRDGVPQYLALLAAGKSGDSVDDAANRLKSAGVVTFAIKAQKAETEELEKIVPDPQFILSAESLTDLSTIQSQFVNVIKTIPVEIPTETYVIDASAKKDIVFLIDGSNDARASFPSLRSFIQRVVESLDVDREKIRIGVVQYSNTARPSFLLNTHPDRQGVISAIQRLTPIGGSPLNTGAALDYVTRNVFTSSAGSRADEGVPQFLILLTTGRSRDDIRRPAVELKSSGVLPFAIGVNNADITEMQTISFIPEYAYAVSDVRDLGNVYQIITTRVSELTAGDIEILRRPTIVTYQAAKRDLVFLVDGSRGATPEFNNVKELIGRIVEKMDVSPDSTRVAVVQYSEDPKVEFLLNAYSTKDEVQNAVRRIQPKGGSSTNTGNALEYVSKNIFTRPSGSRIEERVPQFLILTSSGPSSDDVEEGGRRVKSSSVVPFMIGKNIDNEEARKITFGQNFIYGVSSFRELPTIEQQMLTSVTTLDQDKITELVIKHNGAINGHDPDRRDIVFLVDGSTRTGAAGLANIRDFILKFIENFEVGPDKVRFGLVQFSNEPTSEFFLKTNMNKQALIQSLRRLRLKGGAPLNIGKALEFVTRNHFVKSAGSRIEEGVPQHLMLLTGGRSEDDVRGAARILGDNGVRSLAVAAGSADQTQIGTIVSDPRYLFTIKEFKDIGSIENTIFRSFVGAVEPTPPSLVPEITESGRKEADIVFLVDGSINFGRDNFKQVLEFVSGIVDSVVEEGDDIRIGLAQYNSDVTDEFFLKDHDNRDVIIETVTKAEYKGGRVANLGVAIRHLQDKHFVKEAGSRIGTGVPQIAFVITGAKSVGDGQSAALSLASKGVKIFAIGVGSIASDEIAKVAGDAPSAFRVPNVQQMSELNEQILVTLETALQKRSVCPDAIGAVKECKLEVIIGFDIDIAAGQDIFTYQRGLKSILGRIPQVISSMQKISCSGDKQPSVKVAVLSQGRTGPVEAFDFTQYRPELTNKTFTMGTRGPYVLTGRTLQTYANKFKNAGEPGSIKVVIHMTDGADSDMAELQQASAALQASGVKALLFVGLEGVPKFDQLMQLEFGRGFTYNNVLRINRQDLEYEIQEELDNIAERGCCGVACKCSGERGDMGPPGVIGVKGAPGLKGHQGYPGEEGGPGERGPPGVNGTQGFQGCPGPRGLKGSRGFTGDKGEVGENGLDGIDGEEGKRGSPGAAGERGSSGPRGEKGQKGHSGERGEQGLRGDPGETGTDSSQRGPKGAKGEAGSVGEPGRDGPPGQAGGPGKAGSPGRRGPPGVKGNRGGAGLAGGAGELGLRGPQGPPGQQGTPGTRGEQGIPGPRGPGGTPGAAGDRGRPGPLGRKGEPGDIGPKGSDGPVGPRGETGEDGRDGAGKPGQKGRKGETGFPGYPGPKGDPGDRGTVGDPGPKGGRGRRGNTGNSGTLGPPGDSGYPGPVGLKGERGGTRDQCALVKTIKNTCPCCYGPKECPVFPTDLVFAIDTSSDVNRNQFNNMKDAVLRVVSQITISESNCPRGARVALLTYNSDVTTELRFSEGLRKQALINEIQNLQLKTTNKQRSLDGVMSFVARNTFKRSRGGFLTRKVAVFFSNAPTRASVQLNEAVLKLYDAGVSSVFLTAREDRPLSNALKINNTEVGQAVVLGSGAQFNESIRKVLSCHVCLDVCEPASECGVSVPRGDARLRRSAATDVDIDLAFLLDSSDSTNAGQFAEIKRYISHVIGQLQLSSDPKSSSHHARISVLQQAPYEHASNSSLPPVRIDVGLTEYTEMEKLQSFILKKMTQLYGTRSLNNAIKYVVEHVFESSPNPRATKVIFLILTGEVKPHELRLLRQTVIEAKCKGFFFVILSVGKKVNTADLNSLASEPHDVFSKKTLSATELNEETLLRFGIQLPGFISSENAFHLSPDIQKHCEWFQNDQPPRTSQDFNEATENVIIPDEIFSSAPPEVITVLASSESPIDTTPVLESTTMKRTELQVLDVTQNSVRLSWASPDPQKPHVYDLNVISQADQKLVLKQNVTGTERLIGGLASGHTYQVTITGQHKTHGMITYQATFTTSKSQPKTEVVKPEVVVSVDTKVTTEPLDSPEIDPCELDLDMGTQCKENEVKWFFDKINKICTQFWYAGCGGGNANRFDTEVECITRCQKTMVEKSMQLPALDSKALAVGPEVCNLQKEEGTCRDFVLKWYYDLETKSCARFWYGGCGGNENRFSTQKECEKICITAPLNPSVVSAIGT